MEYLQGTHREDVSDKSALLALIRGNIEKAREVFERFDVNLNGELDPFELQRLMEELQLCKNEETTSGCDEVAAVPIPMVKVHDVMRSSRPEGAASKWKKDYGIRYEDFVEHLEKIL